MNIFFLLLLSSLSAFAQDYTLVQFENSHYRDFTRAEFEDKLGESAKLLPEYSCDGVREQDPLWRSLRHNSKRDSLRILDPISLELSFIQGSKIYTLNGDPVLRHTVFQTQVMNAVSKIRLLPQGELLLSELETSYFPLTIKSGSPMFLPQEVGSTDYRGIYMATAISILQHGRMSDENIPFHDIGVGGLINWNPKIKNLPPHISLGHEMFHALDSIRGILDMRFVQGEKYEFIMMSEHRAVYFENLLRAQEGVALRSHYGNEQTGPGVLDENGEPRLMPSPCLE
jgi:hypothetical protein